RRAVRTCSRVRLTRSMPAPRDRGHFSSSADFTTSTVASFRSVLNYSAAVMVYFPFGPRGSMVSGGQVKASFIPAPARTQCRREKHFFVPVALIRRPFSTASRTRAEGERDEVVQFTPNERLVQITEGALDERLDLPRRAAIAARHHEGWRRPAEIGGPLQQTACA